jgi:DNA repair photolyase
MDLWYSKKAPKFETKKSKSVLHPFIVKKYEGLTVNPYQGCHHRCGYCYATYEWSPDFYDKIYAKSNASQILENQLKSWKSKTIDPVMVSSATDPYQPAELKYGITRKCIQILQKYNVPYYIFTKSTIIKRDLGLHKQYNNNCFIVWSITTCNEKIRRIIEPGTPPASVMFEVIKKFTDEGILCGVNIDPIMPLITDSPNSIESILDSCHNAGVRYVFGTVLRLRRDIWKRMKIILKLLNIEEDGFGEYKRIFEFDEPITRDHNIAANPSYSSKIIENLRQGALHRGMTFDFPHFIGSKCLETNKAFDNTNQLTLMSYM